jgi:type II secretory pathway pseudopilin PulG
MKTRASFRTRRGAAFITTLIFTALLLALSAAILSWSSSEARVNRAHSARLTARNAAEALAEYGTAQASLQIQRVTEFSSAFCNPTNQPLGTPPADFFAGTDIDPATIEVVGGVTPPPLTGGVTFEAGDPRNKYSVFNTGGLGKRGELVILSRASTFPSSSGNRQSVFLRKTLTILDGPVLQYAAFSNTDLEIAPGPDLNIYGPVHTNRDLWVSKQGNASSVLKFWENVTVVGKIRKGYMVQPIQADGGREASLNNTHIQFKNPAGTFIDLYGTWNGSSQWRDQVNLSQSAFLAFTNQVYGNAQTPSSLQTNAHSVAVRRLPGQLDNYVPEINATDTTIEATYRNVPRALIERPLYKRTSPTNINDVEYIGEEVEKQKMSRKAGLYIIVNSYPPGYNRPGIVIPNPYPARSPDGALIPGGLAPGEYRAYVRDPGSSALTPTYREVKLPGQPTMGASLGHTWVLANAGACNVRPVISVLRNQMTDVRRFRTFNHRIARSVANDYDPKIIDLIEVDMTALKMAVDYTVNGQNTSMIFPYDVNWGGGAVAALPPIPAQPAVTSNMDPRYRSTYRARYDAATNEFGVNTGAGLTERIGLPALDARNRIEGMNPEDWDGSVYIESIDADYIDLAYPSGGTTADPWVPGVTWTTPAPASSLGVATGWLRRQPGHRGSGVRLINGRGPIVSANAARLANTAAPCSPGLTLTTNDTLYILGHLNADGRIYTPTGAPTYAQLRDENVLDSIAGGNNSSLFRDPLIRANAPAEQPLALVADAITILSHPTFDSPVAADTPAITAGAQTAGWNDALSHLAITSSNWSVNWATTVPAAGNRLEGVLPSAPPAPAPAAAGDPRRWIFTHAATLSPLTRYAFGIDPAANDPRSSVTTTRVPAVPLSAVNHPTVANKFPGADTEISAGFIVGITPSANNPTDTLFATSLGDGNNSGGLHNLPRFLESWSGTSAIRGSMVIMFESQVAWEPWSLRVYGPPTRLWGFHNFFGNYKFSDDIPAQRTIGASHLDDIQLISRDQYITQRAALWPSESFPTPP